MDERISYYPTGAVGSPAAAEVLAAAVTTVDRAKRHDTDVSTARTGSGDDDTWPARLPPLESATGDPEDLTQLPPLVNDPVGQPSTASTLASQPPNTHAPSLPLNHNCHSTTP